MNSLLNCHWRRSSPTHVSRCLNSRREKPGKLKKAKRKKTSRRRKSFVRAPEQIYFLSRLETMSRDFRQKCNCNIDSRQRVKPRSERARVFIDDTFRPERFKLSLFWQVSLRFAGSHFITLSRSPIWLVWPTIKTSPPVRDESNCSQFRQEYFWEWMHCVSSLF